MWLTATLPYVAVAGALHIWPFVLVAEGPYSSAARREVAQFFGSTGGTDRPNLGWGRAYFRADYAFNGDYDKWLRIDQVPPGELAELLRNYRGEPPIEGCRGADFFGRKNSHPSWWPSGDVPELVAGDGARGGVGSCVWHDPARRRVYAYAWLF